MPHLRTAAAAAAAGALALALLAAPALGADRTGKEVVAEVCSGCHAKGLHGAPRIGSRKAWHKRSEEGITSLTKHALEGIRSMPAHGGKLDLSDLEIARAITYMVNRSGGKWVEPVSLEELEAQRTGAEVVKAQCSKCHQKGLHGAPKIGDRDAWAPRLKNGLDDLVRSAIRGHGGMPPRGDKADLTDAEVRSAILYMYNPKGSAPAK